MTSPVDPPPDAPRSLTTAMDRPHPMPAAAEDPVPGIEWRVAHTLARCEKKVADWIRDQGWRAELPLYRSLKRYRGKKVEFLKPIFPGYVFLQLPPSEARKVAQHRHVARILTPPNPDEFNAQILSILTAVDAGLEIVPVVQFKPGSKVEIVSGPLQGLSGTVEKFTDRVEVILRLDFIGRAASVRIQPHDIEAA